MNIQIEVDTLQSIDSSEIKENNFVSLVKRIGFSLLLIWSISVYLSNVGTDVVLALVYYRSGDFMGSMVTLALVIFPTIITSLLSYTSILLCSNPPFDGKITEETGLLRKPKQEKDEKKESSRFYFIFGLICSIFLLGPIWRQVS